MSLYVDDDRSRARSRSRDRRQRDEEKPSYADVREPSYAYPDDDLDDRYYKSSRRENPSSSQGGGLPYPAEGGIDNMLPGGQSLYGHDPQKPIYRTASPSARPGRSDQPPGAFPGDDDDDEPQGRYGGTRHSRRDKQDEDPRIRYAEPRADGRGSDDDKFKFLPQKYNPSPSDRDSKYRDSRDPATRDRPERRDAEDDRFKFLPQKYASRQDDNAKLSDREKEKLERKRAKKERDDDDLAYGKPAGPSKAPRPESPATYGSYIPGPQADDRRSSRYGARDEDDGRRRAGSSVVDPRMSAASTLTVEPGSRDRDRSRDRRRDASPNPSTLTVEPSRRERDRSRDGRQRDKSPQPPTARMSNLTVGDGRSSSMALSLAAAPGSPLLESYHGTYQDCSPMPSPLLLASGYAVDVEPISPIGSDYEGDGKKRSRRARFHDPEDNASRLARALKGDGPPDREPLVEILPSLTHEQVMELRHQYKNLVKTGSQRKGVNIAKHIRSRLKDDNPNLMKACYAVALGQWESESYWANFWYQGDKTRRELLIESLMGRTNDEMRQIKDSFTDKKYDNSLTKCMKTELKEDKFKKAVLLALEERRMEDFDSHGRELKIDYRLVDQDVEDLRKSVKSEKGGESTMIQIIVSRSDNHLRAILKEYEHHYRANFARDALKKSGNLVVSCFLYYHNPRFSYADHHAGRASRSYPQRCHQPACPRRPASSPRHHVFPQGRAPPRVAHVPPCPRSLGCRAHVRGPQGLQRALWR